MEMTMDSGYVPMPNSDIVLREEFDDWAILFNPDTADTVGINSVGVAAWKLINGKRTWGDIVKIITDEFDEVPVDVEKDLAKFMDELIEGGFLASQVTEI